MTNGPRESTIVAAIVRRLKKRGCVVRKRHGDQYGVKGDPDLYGSDISGRHFDIEVKRPGERPTPLQFSKLNEWSRVSNAGIARSVQDAVDIVAGFSGWERQKLLPENQPQKMDPSRKVLRRSARKEGKDDKG